MPELNVDRFSAQGNNLRSGFAVGSRIRTEHGERAVETLSVGDRIIARHGRLVPIVAASTTGFSKGRENRAVTISQGALGDDRPRRDLTVAPGQLIQTDQGEPVRAIELAHLDGVQVRSNRPKMQFVSVAFDTPEVMFCSGVSVFAKPVSNDDDPHAQEKVLDHSL